MKPRARPRRQRKAPAVRHRRLTAAYVCAPEGGYVAWVAEAVGVHTQGETFEDTRSNLLDVIGLMLDEAPANFEAPSHEPIPPGAFLETVFVVLPR